MYNVSSYIIQPLQCPHDEIVHAHAYTCTYIYSMAHVMQWSMISWLHCSDINIDIYIDVHSAGGHCPLAINTEAETETDTDTHVETVMRLSHLPSYKINDRDSD